ncbi:hypothetical protein FISHEDRAFT_35371 [Fistulina hepatica ATCC 64428]|uniref:Dynein light intermediate chain n=1 Tax=Fistulina hepatica ATCC 64428 TaxID=1128425 RepID=A0A0D7ANG9_9AGAR|nr:hypothetical protein FISHEDRAFT_35371 [Fistulina hepatica ATCC 64428]
MDSRSSTPEAPPQDLWSSILNSVSSSRSIPSKSIIVLGERQTGKSTITNALLQKTVDDPQENDQHRIDFAVGYGFADVKDEGDEDTLARLSVYTIPSSNPAYTALLPHFTPPTTSLPHCLAMIALDWTRPWTFIDDLETWLTWLEQWAKGDGMSRDLEISKEENRERLQSHLQHYSEPETNPLPTTSTLSSTTLLPLGPGTFTHNSSGIPIIVVCTKADLIDEGHDLVAGASGMGGMVKGTGGEWEERTDGVMQILRTICLKYGAALFYTTKEPSTLHIVRRYALHMLFLPPASSVSSTLPTSTSTETVTSIRNPFPFTHKPNTLDRDHIVIPAGWDSWGKINILREGFDTKMWGEAWERDLENDPIDDATGAKAMYTSLVPDQGVKVPPLPAFNSPVPEQTFLAKHYDENSKKPDRDPRGAFRNPSDLLPGAGSMAGVVGPLGSSSFHLPTVERALNDMDSGGLDSSTNRRRLQTGPIANPRPTGLAALAGREGVPRPAGSPGPLSATPGGQTQHEVLQNFFQSLLSSKDKATVGAKKTNGTSGESES